MQKFWETDSTAGIQPKHAKRLGILLSALNMADTAQDMDQPGFNLHPLKHNRKGEWSVWVNGNWRVVFRFEDGDAYVVKYEDYH